MTASQHAVEIKALVKRYGEFVATRDIDLTVEDGALGLREDDDLEGYRRSGAGQRG